MGTCSANVYKVSSEAKVTLTLTPIDKKATFDIVDNDVTSKDSAGATVKANKLAIGEKAFGPFTALRLVYYMFQISTEYSISN
jgi:hypothetical protein